MSWFHVDVEVLFGTFRRRPLPTICLVEKRERIYFLSSFSKRRRLYLLALWKAKSCLVLSVPSALIPEQDRGLLVIVTRPTYKLTYFTNPPLFASWLFICCSIFRPFLSEEQFTRLFTWTLKNTTLSNGYLGSRNDEERSEMRYVMRIAEFSESSNLWTQIALLGSPRSTPLSVSVQQSLSSVFGNLNIFYIFSFLSACWLDNESLSIFPFIGK